MILKRINQPWRNVEKYELTRSYLHSLISITKPVWLTRKRTWFVNDTKIKDDKYCQYPDPAWYAGRFRRKELQKLTEVINQQGLKSQYLIEVLQSLAAMTLIPQIDSSKDR